MAIWSLSPTVERDALLLRAISQGGVIDLEVGHKKLDIGQLMSD